MGPPKPEKLVLRVEPRASERRTTGVCRDPKAPPEPEFAVGGMLCGPDGVSSIGYRGENGV